MHYALLSDAPGRRDRDRAGGCPADLASHRRDCRMNARYPSEGGDRFFFLHRTPPVEPVRGRLDGVGTQARQTRRIEPPAARGEDTSYAVVSSPLPGDIRYVITLDADTRLLRGTVAQLVGKIAHPLNRARFDAARSASPLVTASCSPVSARPCPMVRTARFTSGSSPAPAGSSPMRRRSRTSTRTSLARGRSPARASMTSMPSRPRCTAGCPRTRF